MRTTSTCLKIKKMAEREKDYNFICLMIETVGIFFTLISYEPLALSVMLLLVEKNLLGKEDAGEIYQFSYTVFILVLLAYCLIMGLRFAFKKGMPWDERATMNLNKACTLVVKIAFVILLIAVVIFSSFYDWIFETNSWYILASVSCFLTLMYWMFVIIFHRLEKRDAV